MIRWLHSIECAIWILKNYKYIKYLKKIVAIYWSSFSTYFIFFSFDFQGFHSLKSLSSRCADSTNSLLFHRSWQIFKLASNVCRELMNVGFCWSANIGASMHETPQEIVAYEFVTTAPTLPRLSCLSFLDVSWNKRHVTVLLLLREILFQGFVKKRCTQLYYVDPV